MKIPIELSRKKSAYSVYVYGALDVRLFPNKRLNVDLNNIEIWVSHGLKGIYYHYIFCNTMEHPRKLEEITSLCEFSIYIQKALTNGFYSV